VGDEAGEAGIITWSMINRTAVINGGFEAAQSHPNDPFN